jgi:hypothetical protein
MIITPEEAAEYYANGEFIPEVLALCVNVDYAEQVFNELLDRDFSPEILDKFYNDVIIN